MSVVEQAPKVKAAIEATHLTMEKIYGLAIYCRRVYDLRADDFSLSAMSFLKLGADAVIEKEALTRIMKDLEAVMKPLSEKLTKIKSRPTITIRKAV